MTCTADDALHSKLPDSMQSPGSPPTLTVRLQPSQVSRARALESELGSRPGSHAAAAAAGRRHQVIGERMARGCAESTAEPRTVTSSSSGESAADEVRAGSGSSGGGAMQDGARARGGGAWRQETMASPTSASGRGSQQRAPQRGHPTSYSISFRAAARKSGARVARQSGAGTHSLPAISQQRGQRAPRSSKPAVAASGGSEDRQTLPPLPCAPSSPPITLLPLKRHHPR